jgi:hypothetical protein
MAVSTLPSKKIRSSNLYWNISAFVLAAILVWMSVQVHRAIGAGMVFPLSQIQIQRADGTKTLFRVEVATTNEQQERGLMFRKSLRSDAGMIFVWPQDQVMNMWMKNTLISLDMLFVTHDGRITKIAANAAPLDLTPLSSDAPVRAVIEIGGGESLRQNIKTGDKVLFPPSP